jgi:AcrR family transcriptional regulator
MPSRADRAETGLRSRKGGPEPEPGPGLRERKKAATRAGIQSHALRLFRLHGYHGTTIDQIIAAADVSATTFFRYFPTKEDLVLRDDFDPRIVAALAAQPSGVPLMTAVRAAFREHFAALGDDLRRESRERVALIVTEPALRAAMLDQLSEAIRLLADAFGARLGRPADDVGVRTLAGATVGAMMTALLALADDPGRDLPDLIDASLAHLEAHVTA